VLGLSAVIWMVAAVACAMAQATAQSVKKGSRMAPDEVVAHVKKKDWKVIDVPGQIGPEAGPSLLPLLDDQDLKVRELAVYGLDAAGGKAASQGLLKALNDRSETVRDASLRFLERHMDPSNLAELEKHLQQSPDAYVRNKLSLIIGNLDRQTASSALETQFAKENDPQARHSESLALARLGDPLGRQTVIGRLSENDPGQRADAVSDLIYVNDPRLLVYTRALLEDRREARNVGPSEAKAIIRVCDVVVNTMDVMLNHPFNFVVSMARQYSDAELNQARARLSTIP
jgi:hypothetical protein